MQLPWRILAIVGAIIPFYSGAYGHSQAPGPLSYLSLIENPTIQTPSHRVHSHSRFDIIFNLHRKKQKIKLVLEPSDGIVAEDATVSYLGANGEVARTEPLSRHDHKIYGGNAWVELADRSWTSVGWARVYVHRDGIDPLFEGAFSVSGDHHHVKLRSSYLQTKHSLDPHLEAGDDEYMVVFRDSDIGRESRSRTELRRSEPEAPSCNTPTLSFNTDPQHPLFAPASNPMLKRNEGSWGRAYVQSAFQKRQIDTTGGGNSGGVNLSSTIGSTQGCPTTRKVALIGVATDCTYTATFPSEDAARKNVIAQINSASDVYEKAFNITLALANLIVNPADCPGTPAAATPWNAQCGNTTITDRLNMFSQWRGDRNDTNAYWTLLTNCRTGAEVGLAWLGQACVSDITTGNGETVSGANVVALTPTEWQVIAHESGHTFGAVHDCDSSTCASTSTVASQQCCPLSSTSCDAQGNFIMNPSTGQGISQFSACTIGNVCSAFLRNSVKTTCLSDNKGVSTVAEGVCGNGIVEQGEECDCGGTASCGNNTCCNPTTCKFINNAVCDDSNEDCCNNCQFASAGTVCRKSTSVCDPQETCTGSSPDCPTDATAPNGQSCGSALECASGQCTSRNLQCKTLMGLYTSNNDTYACDSQGCTLSCASPEFGTGTCYSMQQNFLDGTPCGGGGSCSNGQCKGSSTIGEVGSWIHDNMPLVIGLSAGIGGLIVLMILGCIFRRCCGSRRTPRSKPGMSQPRGPGLAYWPGSKNNASASSGWIGGGGGGGGWQPQPHQQGWGPQPSVRYA